MEKSVCKGHPGCSVEGPDGSPEPLWLRSLWARPVFSSYPHITQTWCSPLPSLEGLCTKCSGLRMELTFSQDP